VSALIPVVFVGFLAIVALVAVLWWLQAKRRREGMAAYAGSRGWTYVEDDPSLLDRFEGAPFGAGQDRRAFNVLRGTDRDRPVVVFDYEYVTTSTSTDAEGHTRPRTTPTRSRSSP
jgi:hypothetical protein